MKAQVNFESLGGELSETVLWHNNSPSSSFAGGTQPELSQDIDNFKYIGLKFFESTSVLTDYITVMMTVDDFKKTPLSSNQFSLSFGAKASTGSYVGNTFQRTMNYVSDTKVNISSCYPLAQSTANNNMIIPSDIIGYK